MRLTNEAKNDALHGLAPQVVCDRHAVQRRPLGVRDRGRARRPARTVKRLGAEPARVKVERRVPAVVAPGEHGDGNIARDLREEV